eukprot:RCo010888
MARTSMMCSAELYQPGPDTVSLIDPMVKAWGKLSFPLTHTEATVGLERALAGHPYPPSLCILYQERRCQKGSQCNQIHVSRELVAQARQLLSCTPRVTCCSLHGDAPSQRRDFQGLCGALQARLSSNDGSFEVELASHHIAMTAFWGPLLARPTALEGNKVTITALQLCYLHQRGCCRFGMDCKRVHICREVYSQVAARLPGKCAMSSSCPTPIQAPASPTLQPAPISAPSSAAALPILRERLMGSYLSPTATSSAAGCSTHLSSAKTDAPCLGWAAPSSRHRVAPFATGSAARRSLAEAKPPRQAQELLPEVVEQVLRVFVDDEDEDEKEEVEEAVACQWASPAASSFPGLRGSCSPKSRTWDDSSESRSVVSLGHAEDEEIQESASSS